MWHVYILQCSDNSFYTGHTNNINKRSELHNSGRGSSYTAARLPVRQVWYEEHETEKQAILIEKQIKRWSRAKKEALINGDIKKLKHLSKRKNT